MISSNADLEFIKKVVWNMGHAVLGYDSNQYRKDCAGAWMCYNEYGNIKSPFGWEIDHIKPLAANGADAINNMQPLQWQNNRTKADSYPRCQFCVTSSGNTNIEYYTLW